MLFDRRINRGVALLDQERPGWWERIDLDRLDLHRDDLCVVGLEFEKDPDYLASGLGNPFIFGAKRLNVRTERATRQHGFFTFRNTPKSYTALTQAWHKRIKQIRAERTDEQVLSRTFSKAADEILVSTNETLVPR